MSWRRMAGLLTCVLLLSGVASADIELVDQTLDYTYTSNFYTPGAVDDHQPHYRGSWEDWGWTHDFSDLVPDDALGIQWAQVAISAWDVDAGDGEVDIIYANGVEVGRLGDTYGRNWKTFWFMLPSSVVADLWEDGEVYISIDIDADNLGHRVALGDSTLTVAYSDSATSIPEPATVGLLGLGALVMLKRRRA